ncbi:hypothetical protein CLAFUW4_11715 [Fulvia fulva]|nr:uncharacterized protein CLAFUR5_20321 [Fulvia fulva]KAK4619536.1 hypothetical protein CLAFUR4_11720 [Fulvia fulva]KAK4620756.1 hypothetical protein CLAFUR0_11733 [Fulvia fulva]WMI38969.1 hypothetical protein CLAFUR5_20321 [Fulvia fulva]WPV17023.1 hypothetical protein CLAFUW4_11715 [Fulvia fulva]WPV32585.1 hypothetical protein CLAFUW7_11723 [Fulvia fulva]
MIRRRRERRYKSRGKEYNIRRVSIEVEVEV